MTDTLVQRDCAQEPVPDVLTPVGRAHVELLPSPWRRQLDAARRFYVEELAEEDVLHGFRRRVAPQAPGRPLTGWCRDDSNVVFGQWISTLARFAGSGDAAAGEKARRLVEGWFDVFRADPGLMMAHYPFDKLVGGLVDLARYVDEELATTVLAEVVTVAVEALDRRNTPAAKTPANLADGDQLEWYTLTENLLRAWQLTGDCRYRDFADVWRYSSFWAAFDETDRPVGLEGLHAYSHLNSMASAAAVFAATGDERHLRVATHAHDWWRSTQCYATGGFGPSERTVRADGSLGRALEFRADSFEAPCGSWAAFKLGRHLVTATGDARFSHWTERLLVNGVGAALDVTPKGEHTYYADYRMAGGMRTPYHDTYACCSGSFGQAVTDYPELVYLTDGETVFVNQYVPSRLELAGDRGRVALRLEGDYVATGMVTLMLDEVSGTFADQIAFRLPEWADEVLVERGAGAEAHRAATDGWVRLEGPWRPGDGVRLCFPLTVRAEAVDPQHPDRVAFVRGAAVLVFEASHHEPLPALTRDLEERLVPTDRPDEWLLGSWRGEQLRTRVKPYWNTRPFEPYRMYVDLDRGPLEVC